MQAPVVFPTLFRPDMTPLHIVLVRPEIPHNTGAIGRLCVGLDCYLHLVRPLGFHLDEQSVRRAGMDYWPHVRLQIHDTWEDVVQTLPETQMHFLSTRGTRSLYACTFKPNDVLVFGNEGHGLPTEFYERYRARLFKIPMPGDHARSINLANAASIAVYEAYRQLTVQQTGPSFDLR